VFSFLFFFLSSIGARRGAGGERDCAL